MSKKYFFEEEDEFCYTLPRVKEIMKEQELTECTVIEAQRQLKSGFFFCKEYQTVGEVGGNYSAEGCGKECPEYKPRNGKSGICKHWRHIYQPTDNELTVKL